MTSYHASSRTKVRVDHKTLPASFVRSQDNDRSFPTGWIDIDLTCSHASTLTFDGTFHFGYSMRLFRLNDKT
ncbi:hypothetical protein [Granulicella sp. L46]|uniref:hypothetical protein n=1 Tax=Granulicella sp. L46 TaxID=1641865 RepID=UPI00131A64A4|nr:hypothetical protein [Granulicella sp. L46]